MSRMPENRSEMLRANYELLSRSQCRACSADIEWWQTTNKRKIPFNPITHDYVRAVPHFETCTKQKPAGQSNTPAATPLGQQIRKLRNSTNARVVVVITADGCEAAWANGIPGEDLLHDLISAANFVRNEVTRKEEEGR